MIAVTFALPAESSEFIRLLENRPREKRAGIETVSGRLHGREIDVIHTGVGEKSTRARLPRFLEEEKPTMLISAGFAGAVHDSLDRRRSLPRAKSLDPCVSSPVHSVRSEPSAPKLEG